MYPLIEKGYLYIAQPPLYKVKRGKTETYLKNDAELSEFLLKIGLDHVEVINEKGTLVPSSQLTPALRASNRFSNALRRVSKKLNPQVIRFLVENQVTTDTFSDQGALKKVLEAFKSSIEGEGVTCEYSFEEDKENKAFKVVVATTENSLTKETLLSVATAESTEYEELAKLYGNAIEMGRGPYKVVVKDKKEDLEVPVLGPVELYDKVAEVAKSGLNVQRYKGLGEMNPEQLWETTMDPERRSMLQVTVEDAVAADTLFSVLMGDEVESRRQFIEDNALRVRNLDV